MQAILMRNRDKKFVRRQTKRAWEWTKLTQFIIKFFRNFFYIFTQMIWLLEILVIILWFEELKNDNWYNVSREQKSK